MSLSTRRAPKADNVQVDSIAFQPFANSRKIYITGSRADLRVPMREITQSPTPAGHGAEENPAICVYDTTGPYTDPSAEIDLRHGLPSVRGAWIEERGDTDLLPSPTSEFGRRRAEDQALAKMRF